jgi:hypothetical protein
MRCFIVLTGLTLALAGWSPASAAEPVPSPADSASAPAWDVADPPSDGSNGGWGWHDVPLDVAEGTWMSVDVSPDGTTLVFDLLGDIYTMPIAG